MFIIQTHTCIAGIFGSPARAGDYISRMPVGTECEVEQRDIRFPFYVLETGHGHFRCYQTEADLAQESQYYDEYTIYTVRDDFCPPPGLEWTDHMGAIEHTHVGDDDE